VKISASESHRAFGEEYSPPLKYQLVLQFQAADIHDYDRMIALEDALIASLPSSSIVDGHDFGSGEMNLFIHTNAPEATLKQCLPAIRASDLVLSASAYRLLNGDNYNRLWPPDDIAPSRVI